MLAANGPGVLPTLIAIVTDPAGRLVGLQRTYLTQDGRKAATKATDTDRKPKVKYSLGNVIGGSIQLGPPAASMLVTEGLEDGLTLAQALGRSVWVAAGKVAADKAAEAFGALRLAVRIMRPAPPHKDFNAELIAAKL